MAPKRKRAPGAGRPRAAAAKALGELATVRFDKGTAERLDKFCRAQSVPVTRAQALRALVDAALTAKGF